MRRELANLLCLGRIFGSLVIVCAGFLRIEVLWLAILQSVLLMTDVFDGYFYRKYAKDKPPDHWFNKLGITMDPIADFVFGTCGLAYLARVLDSRIYFLVITVVILSVLANLFGRNSLLVMKLLTYGWFILAMIVPTVLIWIVCSNFKIGVMGSLVTLLLFYFCLWKFGTRKSFRKG